MTDEQHTTNTDSFATLSEASFAEDWDSEEDRVYDEREAKLAALLTEHPGDARLGPFAAVALRMAWALRAVSPCALYNGLDDAGEAVLCEGCDKIIGPALADWDRLLEGLGDG